MSIARARRWFWLWCWLACLLWLYWYHRAKQLIVNSNNKTMSIIVYVEASTGIAGWEMICHRVTFTMTICKQPLVVMVKSGNDRPISKHSIMNNSKAWALELVVTMATSHGFSNGDVVVENLLFFFFFFFFFICFINLRFFFLLPTKTFNSSTTNQTTKIPSTLSLNCIITIIIIIHQVLKFSYFILLFFLLIRLEFYFVLKLREIEKREKQVLNLKKKEMFIIIRLAWLTFMSQCCWLTHSLIDWFIYS